MKQGRHGVKIYPKSDAPLPIVPNSFSIRTYNVLADMFTDGYWVGGSWIRRKSIPRCMQWAPRRAMVIETLVQGHPSVLCLQEVQVTPTKPPMKAVPEAGSEVPHEDENPNHYEGFFVPELAKHGYAGLVQKKKRKFANAVFYRTDQLKLLWRSDRSRVLQCQFEVLMPESEGEGEGEGEKGESDNDPFRFYLNNVHLEGHPLRPFARLQQVMSMFAQMSKRSDIAHCPIFVVGDFNESEEDGIYELLVAGHIGHDRTYGDSGIAYTTTKKPRADIRMRLRSAYAVGRGREPGATFFGNKFPSCIDYIFWVDGTKMSEVEEEGEGEEEEDEKSETCLAKFSKDRIRLEGLMKLRDEDDKERIQVLPNHRYGSDHLSLFARFVIDE